jgi:ATP-dependent helicase HepA
VVRQLRAEIDLRSDAAEQHAARLLEEKKQAAIQRYTEHLQQEIDRLRALREQNPAIRADEIESLENRLGAGREALNAAQISLQGLRLVVTR